MVSRCWQLVGTNEPSAPGLCFVGVYFPPMSDIPKDVLDTARAILATIAEKLTDAENPYMAKLEPREREVLCDAIFQSLDFAYSEGYSDCEMATNPKNSPKPIQ